MNPHDQLAKPAPAMTTADAARVENVLRHLAPKWTTHFVHTIAKYGPELRVRDVAHRHPAINQPYVSKRLAAMADAGLVNRDTTFDRWAPYRLSAGARTLGPLYRAVAQWSSEHLDRPPQGRSDRIEDALRRLQLMDTTEVVRLLSEHGSMRVGHLGERVGVSEQLIATRLNRMQADGLVSRTGSRHGAPYILTDAGRALAPVYTAVQQWDNWHSAAQAVRMPAATRTLVTGADTVRTAAALRRSPAPAGLFSHTPAPQPRVPAAVTAASHPSRGR
ncbi:helix-turn-helix domain-containing protein [Streptomyces sp. LS1784]|uniref:winged helix-turn-helix transcriptional regulator n=1 Tax=Streptomyces sp. LS1784 TaxID=2851533 RepID=UPI001CCCC9B6|nr:winged helix-turn-helix transcriptional regulator [Streptomyces sp. LS1784]